MYELIAIAGGVVVGVGWGLGAGRASGAALGALGVTAAVTAFVLSGEVELSIGFLAWDLLQVLLAAVVTRALVRRTVQVGHQEPHGERPE
jgi:hypothetical protein